jgi:hypothetical protein
LETFLYFFSCQVSYTYALAYVHLFFLSWVN